MSAPTALRNLSNQTLFKKGDIFVLFGELFGRGYANGLVNEARAAGRDQPQHQPAPASLQHKTSLKAAAAVG